MRLTTRRLEALNPISIAEIQAEKDLLRAEFAMSTCRLELRVEEMKAKGTSQLTEIGKKSEAIGRLKLELGEKTVALVALGARAVQLADDLHNTQADLTAKASALEETECALATTAAELAEVRTKLPRSLVAADGSRSRSWRPTAMWERRSLKA